MIRKFSRGISPERFDRFLRSYNLSGGYFAVNRRMVSRAVLVGLFFALLPLPGQMFFVAAMTLVIRFNVAIALALVWLTNPVTMPFIFYFEYELGRRLLMTGGDLAIELDMSWFMANYDHIVIPLYVGAAVAATVSALAGYLLTDRAWVRSVRRDFARRRDA